MPAVTYFVAIPFSRDDEGNLIPGEAKECPNGDRARRMAQRMAEKHAGAIAFSRTGDPEHGDFQDAQVIAVYGAVDVSALIDQDGAPFGEVLDRPRIAALVYGPDMPDLPRARFLLGRLSLRRAVASSVAGGILLVAPISSAHADPLRIYAAGSLSGAMKDLVAASGLPTPAVASPVFGPAGLLRQRIEGGERADLFASADLAQAQAVADKGLGLPPVAFARNRLCVVARASLGLSAANLLDKILDPAVRLATSTPGPDPGGDYAWAVFKRAEALRAGAEALLQGKALKLLGSPTAMAPVNGHSPGASIFLADRADALLYYCSGVAAVLEETAGLTSLPLPADLEVRPVYGLTVRDDNPDAMRFALFILSAQGQAILVRNGLLPVLGQ